MGQKQSKQKLIVFHNAVRNGNIEKVKEILLEGVSLDDQDDVFGTPLHEAVAFDRLEVAELLIQHKADVNLSQRHHGDTPLCIACRKGHLAHAELLVRNGVRINQQGKGGQTPLHCALEGRHEDLARFLVGASASVNVLDTMGMSPLHVACKHLCKLSVELILSSPPSNSSTSVTVAGQTPVTTATLNGHDMHNMTAIMYACQTGDVQLVEFLLKSGAKTKYDTGKSAPLHVTTSVEVATLMLAHGADINARDENCATPLHNACNSVNAGELVQLFLENRADLSPHDTSTRATPLHCACKQGAYGNAELLLKRNADPNALDVRRNTPLHVASAQGYTGIAQLLVKHGADPNLLNAEGMTPAQLALHADD